MLDLVFDSGCNRVALEIEVFALGMAAGGGEFTVVVELEFIPVPVLYWSPVPPLLQPARANAAHNMINVLFIVFSSVLPTLRSDRGHRI